MPTVSEFPRRPGRPSAYTEEIADEILIRLAQGETLNKICTADHLPWKTTVLDWVIANRNGFHDRYRRARDLQLEHWSEETVDISDDGSNDWVERARKNGEIDVVLDREHVSRSELRVNTRKWLLSKLKPEKYGERVDVNQNTTFKTVTDKPLTKEEETARWLSQFGNVRTEEGE